MLVHVTFPFSYEHIRRLGLRPASQLVSEADLGRAETDDLLAAYRKEPAELKLADGTLVVLRDQVRNRRRIEPALDSMTEVEWLTLLNQRVYLFPATHRRVRELIGHYNARGLSQDLISFDTFRLLAPYGARVEVATVNSGVFPRTITPVRGRKTFVALADLPVDELAKVQEVTLQGALPIRDRAVRVVERHSPGGRVERIGP